MGASSTTAAAPASAPVMGAAPGESAASDFTLDAPTKAIFLEDLRRFFASTTDGDTGLAKIAALQKEAEDRYTTYRDSMVTQDAAAELSGSERRLINDLVQQVVSESIDRDAREKHRQAYQPYNQAPRAYGYAPPSGYQLYYAPQPMLYQPVLLQPIPNGHGHSHHKR